MGLGDLEGVSKFLRKVIVGVLLHFILLKFQSSLPLKR